LYGTFSRLHDGIVWHNLTYSTDHSTAQHSTAQHRRKAGTTMAQTTAQKKEYIKITLALYGYGIATYSPGDGYTRYRITENTDVDYFATYGIFTGSLAEVYVYCQALRYTHRQIMTQSQTIQALTAQAQTTQADRTDV
jgi:hypothetical protein